MYTGAVLHLCVCVVVVRLVITVCVSLTVLTGKALRLSGRSALCWNPGSTVCLTRWMG